MIAHLIDKIKIDFCNNNHTHWSDNKCYLIHIHEPSDHVSMKNIRFCLSDLWISGFCIKNISISYDHISLNFNYYRKNVYITHSLEIF